VSLRKGRLMARCRGAGIELSLGEPAQGALGVRLELGSKTTVCALFGGDIRADFGIGFGRSLRRGSFSARNAAAPASCPI
jgi:hypothetical protein